MKPILKWVGGKRQLLSEIMKLMPQKFNTYYEPFLGGGALFFELAPQNAVLNDALDELINVYKCFESKEFVEELKKKLDEHQMNHSEDYFYKIRSLDKDENYSGMSNCEKAARTIYLNKSCFNGLYRLNSKGYFNSPSGKKNKVILYDEKNFDEITDYLTRSNVVFTSGDYEKALSYCQKDDFVYLDPPYDTIDGKKSFTSYTKDSFGRDEQRRLKSIVDILTKKGVKVMISNHNTNFIRELYKDYNIHVVFAKRAVNSDASGRGDVEEVIITNYKI